MTRLASVRMSSNTFTIKIVDFLEILRICELVRPFRPLYNSDVVYDVL